VVACGALGMPEPGQWSAWALELSYQAKRQGERCEVLPRFVPVAWEALGGYLQQGIPGYGAFRRDESPAGSGVGWAREALRSRQDAACRAS
jgi:hypothetical protein